MPVKITIVDDYEIVVAGVASMLEPYTDRVEVVEIYTNVPPSEPVDIALYDGFAQGQADHADLTPLLADPVVARVVMYTWNFDPGLLQIARRRGLAGYLSKSLPGDRLADDLQRIADDEFVVTDPALTRRLGTHVGDWPGRPLGLTERESEVLALITQGATTKAIAGTMYLSPNSVKTHVKSLYRKIGVHSRSEAILWGIDHGFRPDRYRERRPND